MPLTILLASVATLATCFILTYEQGYIRGVAMNIAVRISIKGIIVSILYLTVVVYRRYCDAGIFPVKKIELKQILAEMDELKKDNA